MPSAARAVWRAPLAAALAAALALVGCTCGERQGETPRPAAAPDAAARVAGPRGGQLRRPSVHDQMQKIQRFTEELRRRVQGNVTVVGPARVVRATLQTVPVHRYPKSFKMFHDGALARSEALITSKNPGRDYNLLVDRCVACHAIHAQGYLELVKRLKLPVDQLPKGPPPPERTKRPGPELPVESSPARSPGL